jgi:hypothetical protein
MDKIVDGLYLGDIRAASNLFLLKQHVRLCFAHEFRVSLMCSKLYQDLTHAFRMR